MGLFTNMLSGIVKTALTPVAVVKDTVNIVTGQEVDSTKKLLESAKEDIEEAMDDLAEGDF